MVCTSTAMFSDDDFRYLASCSDTFTFVVSFAGIPLRLAKVSGLSTLKKAFVLSKL